MAVNIILLFRASQFGRKISKLSLWTEHIKKNQYNSLTNYQPNGNPRISIYLVTDPCV
jgi:hypothetical protein